MFLIVLIGWLFAGGLALLLLVLGLECWLALLPKPTMGANASTTASVIIPAHNEAAGIQRTLDLLKPQIGPNDRILVVADNCNDATASLAKKSGVEVIERFHDTNRGKGFALEAGVRYLESNSPPEVLIILDADCELEVGSFETLVSTCASVHRPVQARYLMRMPNASGPASAVSAFAFLLKNWVRARGLGRMGIPAILAGTGMAFPWNLITNAPLGSGEIVEDLSLGLHFARTGFSPVFCDQAGVWSELPSDDKVAISQRTRWEHGYLSSIFRDVPGFFVDAVRKARPSLLLVALDLMVPPLALLALGSAFVSACLLLLGIVSGTWGPLMMLLVAGAFATSGIAVAWYRFARHLIPASVLLAIPWYVVGKLSIYRRFVTHRQKEWVRTERN